MNQETVQRKTTSSRVKPLYRYAGGKVRLLTLYHPFFVGLRPEYCVDYFGGSGTMSLWFHQLYPDATLYMNEKDPAIYKLFRCVKEDYDLFIGLVKDIDYEYSSTVSEVPFVYVQWGQAVMLFPVIETCKLVAL